MAIHWKQSNWKQSAQCIYNTQYYVFFCSKYRRKILVGEVETTLKQLIEEKLQEMQIEMGRLEIQPDSVSFYIRANPILAPHFIVCQVKGHTHRGLKPLIKNRLPTIWTRHYYIESIGFNSPYAIQNFFEQQKGV